MRVDGFSSPPELWSRSGDETLTPECKYDNLVRSLSGTEGLKCGDPITDESAGADMNASESAEREESRDIFGGLAYPAAREEKLLYAA